jgi:hypothetical protein
VIMLSFKYFFFSCWPWWLITDYDENNRARMHLNKNIVQGTIPKPENLNISALILHPFVFSAAMSTILVIITVFYGLEYQ